METRSFSVGQLKVNVFDTRDEMGKAAAKDAEQRINRIIAEKGEATVVFAAAPSQNELLEHLCKSSVDWTKVRALHQDEYVGLPADHPAGFGNFLRRAIFDAMPFKEIYYLYNPDESPEALCDRYEAIIAKYPPDLVLLGVGENGHLAFNDPAVADFCDPRSIKLVELDDVCRNQQVNDGCFEKFDDVPKRAMTLTMSAIVAIPERITVVPGCKKANAINGLINGGISTQCPASILKVLAHSSLYLDTDSASIALK